MDLLSSRVLSIGDSLEARLTCSDGTRGGLRARVWPLVEGRASVRKNFSSENNKKYTR